MQQKLMRGIPRGVGNAGKVAKPCTTTHCKIRCSSCLESARKTSERGFWNTHSCINDGNSEVTLGKEMVERRKIPRGGADSCRRSHESDGVWMTVV